MNTGLKAPRYLPHLTRWVLECSDLPLQRASALT